MNLANRRKSVALIFGGAGKEHAVSVRSAEYASGIIDREKYELLPVFIDTGGGWSIKRGRRYVPTFPVRLGKKTGLLAEGKVIPVDCAIPLLHGDFGEDGRVQGALATAGIAHVGADTPCGAVSTDKGFTRAVAASLGIPIARGRVLSHGATNEELLAAAGELGLPVFVKPTRLGSSIGASPATTEQELIDAFHSAARHGCDVLVEELIGTKRELEIGLLVTGDAVTLSPVGEVMCAGFYDFERKYHSGTATRTRASLTEDVREKIREYSLSLAAALGLRGPARIDFFLSGERLLFNEINTMPGFTADSLYPLLMAEAGITPTELFTLMIEDVTEGEG